MFPRSLYDNAAEKEAMSGLYDWKLFQLIIKPIIKITTGYSDLT